MEAIIMAVTTGVVLSVFMVSWNLWLEKLFIKFVEKLDEWKNGETFGVMIDPYGLGLCIRSTVKGGKMRYFEGGKRTTKEKFYKITGLYVGSAIKGGE